MSTREIRLIYNAVHAWKENKGTQLYSNKLPPLHTEVTPTGSVHSIILVQSTFSLRAGALSHFGIKASYTSNMRFLWNSYIHGVKHNIISTNVTISRMMSVTLRLYTHFSIKIRLRTYINKDSFQPEWAL